jgi:OPA family glycerol-3-phosphate transporter-like MFS transporter
MQPDVDLAGPASIGPSSHVYRRMQWRVLSATMFCYLFYYTGRQSFGFAIPGIQEELGLSKRDLGFVSTALLWSYALGQAVNGNLADRFGGRRMVGLGAALSCGLNWIVSLAQGLPGLFVPWGLNGFAQSMGWAPGSRVLSNWWPHRERGRAYGFYVFAAGMSSVLTYALANLVLESGLGWRWIFRLPVLLLLVGAAAYSLLVRDRPSDLGWPPPDEDDAAVAAKCDAPGDEPIESSAARYRAVLGNPRFLAACISIGFQSLARYGLLIWVPVYFLGADWKDSTGGRWINLFLPIGMAFGALVSGKLSDKYFDRRRWALISLFLAAAAAVSLAMFIIPRGHSAGMGLLFLCGFFAYGPQSAYWALCPDLLGVRRAGTGTGVMNTFAYLLAGLGEPLIGHILETRPEGAVLVFPIVAGSCLIGAIVAPFIRR